MADVQPGATRLPDLYTTDATHGWSIGMRAVTHALLAATVFPPGPILELGCGAGGQLAALAHTYPDHPRVGTDIHPLALAYARRAAPTAWLYQGDMTALPFAAHTFAAILCLDALDQVGVQPPVALCEIRRVLQPQGIVLARVSAHPWLAGPHDAAFNTRHRYTHRELRQTFVQAGFRVRRITYANASLGLLAVLPRLLQRWGLPIGDERNATGGATARRLFSAILATEARALSRVNLPFGLSLYIEAQSVHEPAAQPVRDPMSVPKGVAPNTATTRLPYKKLVE
ncbi:MAG: class I SAM-dependent methyltransferase [Litorilinea sp.]